MKKTWKILGKIIFIITLKLILLQIVINLVTLKNKSWSKPSLKNTWKIVQRKRIFTTFQSNGSDSELLTIQHYM